jgi:hypothetical protein
MEIVGESKPTWTALILASMPVRDRRRLTMISRHRVQQKNGRHRHDHGQEDQAQHKAETPSGKDASSVNNVLRPDLQAFVLILPDDGRKMFQELRQQLAAGEAQQLLRLLRRVVVSLVVIGTLWRWRSSQCATAWTGAYSSAHCCTGRLQIRRQILEGDSVSEQCWQIKPRCSMSRLNNGSTGARQQALRESWPARSPGV